MAAVLTATFSFLRRFGAGAGAGLGFGASAGLGLLALATLSVAIPAKAEPIRYPDEPFAYVVVRQDIRGFLREFSVWAGVYLNLDRSVQGMIDGPLPDVPPNALLNSIAAENGLYWWFDGAVLHVGPATEIETSSIPLPAGSADIALETLERLAVIEPRFPVRIDSELGLASATGPKIYVQKVSEALEAAALSAGGDRAGWRTVRIVRNGRVVDVAAPRGPVRSQRK